jgi:putative colanic acid biosysnthesis UDP-glucose lipid carrier transferase
MNTRYNSLFQFLFSLYDMLALNIIFVSALFYSVSTANKFDSDYLLLFVMWNLFWVLSSAITRLYINVNYFRYETFLNRSFVTVVMFLLFMFFYNYIFPYHFGRHFLEFILIGYPSALLLSRVLFVALSKLLNLQAKLVRRIVIIGYNDVAKNLSDHYFSFSKNVVIEGYFEDYKNVKELSAYPILGNVQDTLKYAIDNNISEIYSTLSAKDFPFLYEMAEVAENNFIRFKFVPDFHLYADRNIHIDYIEDIPILSLRSEPLEDIANRIKKRTFDIVFSLCVIVFLLSWLFPILAIWIKLDSKGPVFFNQNRLGRDLKKIKVFKFRSMRTTESDTQYKQATKDDPRVTKVGRILRKTSLDELPQFFNVLLGNMSIVGPRPHPLKMNDDYKRIIDKYMIRHFLKPGITGWAQVNGYRGETKDLRDIKGRVEHDIWYMENWNFLLDIKIIYLTVYNIIKGEKNAY